LISRNKWLNIIYRIIAFPFLLVKALIIAPINSFYTIRDILSTDEIKNAFYKIFHQLNLITLANKAQVIHFEWNNQATNYLEALSYIEKPVIVSIRGRGISSQPLVNKSLANKLPLLFKRADYIHSISKDLVEKGKAFGVKEDKVVLVPPAIDLKKFIPPEERDFNQRPLRIITVAHLVWKKHILGAIQTVKILVEEGYDLTYTVIGEGPEREPLTYAINDFSLNNRVFLPGRKPHEYVIQALAEGHIFLLPSVQEGFCNAVIEAQAMGLPVVVTDAEGLRENVEENVTGLIAKRWDIQDMAAKLEKLINDPELCVSLGEAGRQRAFEKFGIEKQIEGFEKMYYSLINKQ